MTNGFFGIGVYHPKFAVNTGTLWRSAHAFGAAFCFTVGHRFERQASDTTRAWTALPFYEYADLDTLVRHVPYSCPLVGVELAESGIPLQELVHPDRAIYLLGAEDNGLPKRVLERCHLVTRIPFGESCLNVAVAGSIVMYDRACRKGVRK